MIRCPGCDVVFEVAWHRSAVYSQITCCPFCTRSFDSEELEELERLDGDRPGLPSDKVPPPSRPKLSPGTVVEIEDDSEDLEGGFFDLSD